MRAQEPPDPLYELVASGSALSVEEADRLLHQAYDAYPTATTRSRAFAAAAATASSAGRHELALAWIDWAIREAESAPERARLLGERLGEGVGIAVAAGEPVLARGYARRAAGLEDGWRDEPETRGLRFPALGLACPDVIANTYIRIGMTWDPGAPGVLALPSARCRYVPIRQSDPRDASLEAYAVRSRIDLKEKMEGVLAAGLDAADAAERARISARLSSLRTETTPLFLGEERGLLGYAQSTRAGVNEVASHAYALAARGDVLYAGTARGPSWDWPPAGLGARAEAGLRAALGAPAGKSLH